ncbi:MlaA family lipoprotein [Aerolutibacter ruishenii]|uniref:Phospholipid-binding lipoprotein MlaA n=1 Tax=Aerolutibacter ruishenii TaxID=686800 RepID=A0A562M0J2_9GAMM|nr:MlaA family lipoprotein [Lysobacter ruishenii]TWI13439.1 phospholipid-binding lipoprotein MlaA [Lysobacter ruishenii]
MRAHGLALALAGLLATAPHAFAQAAAQGAEPAAPAAVEALAVEVAEAPPATNAPVPAPVDATGGTPVAAATPTDAATTQDPATAPPTGTDARTNAERDFDALYGNGEPYNPVADPTLPPAANVGVAYDPWERYNRPMHRFNNAVDRTVARPLARAYVRAVPRPVRLGVTNFFNNLGQPVSAVNALLQGKPRQAAHSLGRFVVNSTLGIAGLFDPASDAKLDNRREDFGQTLGVWGWKRSRYVELPLFGPRTLRDTFGMAADAPLSPVRQIEEDKVRVGLQGLQLVDVRAQLLAIDSLREGAEDDYTLVRDAWMQRRDYQIFGDRQLDSDQTLPDYLKEENNPLVPIDAIPVTPSTGNN